MGEQSMAYLLNGISSSHKEGSANTCHDMDELGKKPVTKEHIYRRFHIQKMSRVHISLEAESGLGPTGGWGVREIGAR